MTDTVFEITKAAAFDAAHRLPAGGAEGSPYTRLHGHSFRVEVALVGEPDPKTGCVVDFEVLGAALIAVREKLDHHFLNDLPDLGIPSLENIARWIAGELSPNFSALQSVTVRRPSLGESCRFELVE